MSKLLPLFRLALARGGVLLISSSAAPLYDSSNIWEGSHLYLSNSTQNGSSALATELNGLRELEDLFQTQVDLANEIELLDCFAIPALCDEVIRSLSESN
jgi:hypothetical protein